MKYLLLCLLFMNGCTVVSANRTFPKLSWYWSDDAKMQRQYELPLCGCVRTASIMEQLKNDPATVHFSVQTLYGTIVLDRSFPTNWTPAMMVITNK